MNEEFISQKLNEPNEYKECYVAFLDMLGFKELCGEEILQCKIIKAIFNDIELLIQSMSSKILSIMIPQSIVDEIEFCIMSDSIVLSAPNQYFGIVALLYLCCRIQTMLLSDGIPVRGGITKGKFFILNNIMFGPALVEAYILESSVSVYPRIVVSQELINDLVDNGNFGIADHKNQLDWLINQSKEDGKYFVHSFNFLEMIAIKNDLYNKQKKIETTIARGLNHKDNKVREKYKWLDEYYRNSVNAGLFASGNCNDNNDTLCEEYT